MAANKQHLQLENTHRTGPAPASRVLNRLEDPLRGALCARLSDCSRIETTLLSRDREGAVRHPQMAESTEGLGTPVSAAMWGGRSSTQPPFRRPADPVTNLPQQEAPHGRR